MRNVEKENSRLETALNEQLIETKSVVEAACELIEYVCANHHLGFVTTVTCNPISTT